MKKSLFLIFAAMLLCVSNIMAQVVSGVCGENITWELTAEGELVIEGTGEMADFTFNTRASWYNYRESISSVTIGEGITNIGEFAFRDCTNLTAATISASVTTIGNDAFWGTGLTSFIIPENSQLAIIGDWAFNGSASLTTISFPASLTSIGYYAFNTCNFTSITCNAVTPPSASTAFPSTDASALVYVPAESVDAYKAADGWSKFTNWIIASGTCGDNLAWTLSDEDELVIEGTGEMYNYSNNPAAPWNSYSGSIKSVDIKDGVTSIGSWAFAQCSALTDVSISESVTNIGGDAFRECRILEEITLPAGLTQLGTGVFLYCDALKSITVPEGVTIIGSDTFEFCPQLSSITFPSGLTEIGPWALKGCNNLAYITCKAATPPSLGNSVFAGVSNNIPVYVPTASVEAYKAANGWSQFANIQPIIIASGTCGDNLTWKYLDGDELVIEGTGEMYNYSNNPAAPWNNYSGSIKSVDIKDGVTSIGSWAFAQCSALTDVSISESVTNIGGDAFRECRILEEITLPAGLTQLGTGVFLYCDALKSITVPEGVTIIGSDTFEFCPQLSSITFPSGLTEIGPWALMGCYNLASITCKAATPPSLGNSVFADVNNNIPVYVPTASVEAYKAANGWSQFANIQPILIASGICGDNVTWKLTDNGKLVIEGAGEMIDAPWSEYKEYIKEITIKEGVTSICNDAFRECNKVTTTIIPAGVRMFGWDVFYGCTGELYLNSLPLDTYDLLYGSEFTSIVIGEGITEIRRFTFKHLNSLKEIVLPVSLTTIEDMAFAFSPNITTVICKGTQPPVCSGNLFDDMGQEKTLYVPINATSNYHFAEEWKNFDYIVGTAKCGDALTCELWPDGKLIIMGEGDITSAPWSTCREQVKELIIEEGVTGIADEAFSSFENLLSITLYAQLPPVCNADAFADVDKRTPVYVPADKLDLYVVAEGWSEFFNITSNDSRILLDNFAEYSNAVNEDFDEITYKRTFNNTEWQALYVPFEIPVTEKFLEEFEVADLNDIRQYDHDNNGVADETVVEAFMVTDGVLEANYPYLIRAKVAGEKSITVTDATLYATEENSIDCSSVHERYIFTSTYSTIATSALTGCYALNNGIWQPIADDASLGAFRFYLSIESRDGNMPAARNIRMRIIGKETGDGTTSIDNISDAENLNSEIIYDLKGRSVTAPEKGLYIINGKKVFIK